MKNKLKLDALSVPALSYLQERKNTDCKRSIGGTNNEIMA